MSSRKRAAAPAVLLPPQPKVLPTSGTYEGNDGKWSAFFVNIAGDGEGKGQNFKVLISTSSPIVIVPAQTEWCNETCSGSRGIMQLPNGQQPKGLDQGTTLWNGAGIYDLPKTYYTNGTLGGTWGLTNIGLGSASRNSYTLTEQYVATSQDFFLGSLGLSVGEISPTGADQKTFLSRFATYTDQIASNSYGYTAGAVYRNNGKGAVGSMVFGGYDRSRFTNQGQTIAMPNKQNNTLLVGVLSITYAPKQDVEANTYSFTNTSGPFSAVIDSTLPYLVLPDNICDRFVQEFGLRFDRDTGLYTVNSTAHDRNLQQNATVSFKIGSGPQDSAKFTNIILPYAAFDLQASVPTYPTPTNYFPLKKSSNGIFVLGRTFLQEAYIIVDYERGNFTVAPAYFADPLPKEELVSIWNTTYVLPTTAPPNVGGGGRDGLSAGAIAGTVVGIVSAFLLLGIAAFLYWKKRRTLKTKGEKEGENPSEIDTTAAGFEVKHRRISELTGSEAPSSPGYKPAGSYYGGDPKIIGPISEMSPESTPAELYSPPPEGGQDGYFAAGPKPRRRGATRDSSGPNTPGTPVAELPGDEGIYPAMGPHPAQRPKPHSRGPSDNSLSTNIAEVLAAPAENDATEAQRKHSSRFIEHTGETGERSRAEQVVSPMGDERQPSGTEQHTALDRRPSHTRGLSDTTVNSESTAVSHLTPEELEQWRNDDGTQRPLSP